MSGQRKKFNKHGPKMRKEKTSGIKILKNTPHEKFKKIGGCFFASMLNLIPLISIFL